VLRIAVVLWIVTLVSLPLDKSSVGQSTTPVCITHPDTAGSTVRQFEFVIANASDLILADANLPPRAQAAVSLVTSDSLCTLGVLAYNASLSPSDSMSVVTRILLLKVGATRYVASYPPRRGQLLLDTSFSVLGSIL
jgi:hypothetical protein